MFLSQYRLDLTAAMLIAHALIGMMIKTPMWPDEHIASSDKRTNADDLDYIILLFDSFEYRIWLLRQRFAKLCFKTDFSFGFAKQQCIIMWAEP